MRSRRPRALKDRPPNKIPGTLPGDLYDYVNGTVPRRNPQSRNRSHCAFDTEKLSVIDNWPEQVPVTEAEIQVFERWFGDVFDELFNPPQPKEGLSIISDCDMENRERRS